MFRFSNFYKEVGLLEKHHKYMQDKKNKEQRNKTLKAAGLLIATAVVAVMVYKSSGWKNMLKGHFGEL
jgi:hypothetical protein